MYYEVIYENGTHSVMSAESDEEALEGLKNHHARAVNGVPGTPAASFDRNDLDTVPPGPQVWDAVRIVKVLKYDHHPADYGVTRTVSKKEITDVIKEMGETVNLGEVTSKLNELSDPMVDSGPHESNYKMAPEAELTGWEA